MPLKTDIDKKAVAAHLVTVADNALAHAASTLAKVFNDACDAGCLPEFGACIKSRDIESDAAHFLGPDRMRQMRQAAGKRISK